MDENPYQAPESDEPKNADGRLHPFFRLPTSPIDWIVIVIVVIVIAAMFLPNIEEGREAARQKAAEKQNK